jgi:MbtH protein
LSRREHGFGLKSAVDPAREDESEARAAEAQPAKENQQMSREDREDTTIYKVVVNHEEQYSIWPADRENALGWNDVGKSGTRQECLDYIQEVWTDMRPLSIRDKMERLAREGQGEG